MCLQTYVQHLLKKNAETVVKQLIEERGHFYVCGDISMAADVCRTLQVCVYARVCVCVCVLSLSLERRLTLCLVQCYVSISGMV